MADEVIYDFGARVRRLREDRGLSQAALAKKLGVGPQTVYRYSESFSGADETDRGYTEDFYRLPCGSG